MTKKLRIAVADDEADMRDFYAKMLPRMGHEVVILATNGIDLVQQCQHVRPDLIITDIRMPELDGIEAVQGVDPPVPVILVSAFHDPDFIERAQCDHILAYLLKPIKAADLEPTIALTMQRFTEFMALRQQAADLQQALDDRKLIERAKGILMKRAQLDESAAFSRLQKLSNDKNQKMVEIARVIVAADDAFN